MQINTNDNEENKIIYQDNPPSRPINITKYQRSGKYISRSFDDRMSTTNKSAIYTLNKSVTSCPIEYPKNRLTYNAILRSKGAGIIPYAFVDGEIYFLFQHADIPCKKKEVGWNDFGGKKNGDETTFNTASREFSEETSCLFYLKENDNDETNNILYRKLKNNFLLEYDDNTISDLLNILPLSQQFFLKKINETASPLYINSKETYISYFVKVQYVPAKDLPTAEDLHIKYDERYRRTCKWFTYNELMELDQTNFHRRLQITKIKQRIKSYYEKNLFN
jgi:hypothetical protein